MDMLSRDLHYADFVPLVNTSFALHGAAAVAPRVDIVLTSAMENTNAPTHEQFSLLFRGPSEPQVTQATYTVSHPDLGKFLLFLVPVGRDPQGLLYEACFNRIRARTAGQP
jgi:uncharacterized protein DUF6916